MDPGKAWKTLDAETKKKYFDEAALFKLPKKVSSPTHPPNFITATNDFLKIITTGKGSKGATSSEGSKREGPVSYTFYTFIRLYLKFGPLFFRNL